MLKGKILNQLIHVIELNGEESLSYTYNFSATIISENSINNPIQQTIETENWSGYIIFWSFLYIDTQGRHYYKCNFCSRFELLNSMIKFNIYENLSAKEIVEEILDDTLWRFVEGFRHPYLVQYEESNLNVVRYLSYLNGFAYFERDDKTIFTDKPYLFTKSIEIEFSNVKQLNKNITNSFGFEIEKKDPITEIYGFNIDRPNDDLYSRSGIQKNAEYWSEVLSPAECEERLSKINKNNVLYKMKTVNAQLQVGDKIVFSNHKLAGHYYITRIKHIYNQNEYKNWCEMLRLENLHHTPKVRLNSPQGLQVATISSAERGVAKLRFQWSEKLMRVPIISSTAGKEYGAIIMPKCGERVIIGFEGPCKPFLIGSIYDSLCRISAQEGYVFRSQDEAAVTQLAIKDKSSLLEIETSGKIKAICADKANDNKTAITLNKNEFSIKMGDPNGKIIIKHGETEMVISKDTVLIQAPSVKICTREMDIQANKIIINASDISVLIKQHILLRGAIITMQALQNASISSAAVNFYTNILNSV